MILVFVIYYCIANCPKIQWIKTATIYLVADLAGYLCFRFSHRQYQVLVRTVFLSEGFIWGGLTSILTHVVISSTQSFVCSYTVDHIQQFSLTFERCHIYLCTEQLTICQLVSLKASNRVSTNTREVGVSFVTLFQKEISHHFCYALLIACHYVRPTFKRRITHATRTPGAGILEAIQRLVTALFHCLVTFFSII